MLLDELAAWLHVGAHQDREDLVAEVEREQERLARLKPKDENVKETASKKKEEKKQRKLEKKMLENGEIESDEISVVKIKDFEINLSISFCKVGIIFS